MFGTARCDEILRLIDEALAASEDETAPATARVRLARRRRHRARSAR